MHSHPHVHSHALTSAHSYAFTSDTHIHLSPTESTRYEYMQQLQVLDRCRPLHTNTVPASLAHLETPVKLCTWRSALEGHPDQEFAKYILDGLAQGFRIGFCYDKAVLRQSGRIMPCPNPEVVDQYLSEELRLNRIVKLTKEEAARAGVHCSPIGIIPKKNRPGKWRLIVDLSAPEGASTNDGVDKEACSLSYTSVDHIAARVAELGRGTLLAKMDVKQAYRMVPVHPSDRHLLGMLWRESVYVDKALPFGLRSAPILFTAVADALQWMMQARGVSFVAHYIDDFITLGSPSADECARNVQTMLQVCREAGVPIEESKSEGPASALTFLGIEIDSVAMEIRLPADKLTQVQSLLRQWRGKKACTKRELQSITASLSHACKVVRPGRAFLRRLIDLAKLAKRPHHHLRLCRGARSDLEWWFQFIATWNGVSMIRPPSQQGICLTSDASGKWGCGAFCEKSWFQLQWPESIRQAHISVKELVPIVLAAAVWGSRWIGRAVLVRCDNSAVVDTLNKGSCRDPELMHLVRCLAFLKAKFQFSLMASHIAGSRNVLADALSRDNLACFLSRHPQASPVPTPLPQELVDLMLISRPDWTSPRWTELWSATFAEV